MARILSICCMKWVVKSDIFLEHFCQWFLKPMASYYGRASLWFFRSCGEIGLVCGSRTGRPCFFCSDRSWHWERVLLMKGIVTRQSAACLCRLRFRKSDTRKQGTIEWNILVRTRSRPFVPCSQISKFTLSSPRPHLINWPHSHFIKNLLKWELQFFIGLVPLANEPKS